MTPLWLQILQALAVLFISAVGAWLAWQQVQIARVKLQHDLYDRRYRVFEAVRALLVEVVTHADVSDEAVSSFVRGTGDAVFLFDDDLDQYLQKMRGHAMKLRGINAVMDALTPQSTDRANAVKQASEHKMWLIEQLDGLPAKFKPSLKLDKRDAGDIEFSGFRFNWRQGALRLWVVASVVWCVAVFSIALLQNENISWLPVEAPAVHVKISDRETWDYPAEWGVQRIKDDLQKRLAAEDEKDREWAAQVPTSRKDECRAIPSTTPFSHWPGDCVRLFFAKDSRAVPSGWESQVATALPPPPQGFVLDQVPPGWEPQWAIAPRCKNGGSSCKPWERDWAKGGLKPGLIVTEQGIIIGVSAWGVIAAAAPWAIAPPLAVLALSVSLFWVVAGFRRGSS